LGGPERLVVAVIHRHGEAKRFSGSRHNELEVLLEPSSRIAVGRFADKRAVGRFGLRRGSDMLLWNGNSLEISPGESATPFRFSANEMR
jgi:hypothetical protein